MAIFTLPSSGATSDHFWGFCSITHVIETPIKSKYLMCAKHNVLKLWLRQKKLASLFRIYFGEFPVFKVRATLDQRPSGGINPRPNGIWQERRGPETLHDICETSLVKSTTPPILLHCDVIGNIQKMESSNQKIESSESSSKCSAYHDI